MCVSICSCWTFYRIHIFLTVPDTHHTSIICMCRHQKLKYIQSIWFVPPYVHVLYCREEKGSGSHRLSGDEKWERSQCWNINPPDLWAPAEKRPVPADRNLESSTHRRGAQTAWWGGAKGALQKRAGCMPLGPRQLSDTIAYTVQKHMYKDTRLYTREKRSRGWEEQSWGYGERDGEKRGKRVDRGCLTWPLCLLKWWKPPGWSRV